MTVELREKVLFDDGFCRVVDSPGGVLYSVIVGLPGQPVRRFDNVHAYVNDVAVSRDGEVSFAVHTKHPGRKSCRVLYPFHFLYDGVLYAWKRKEHRCRASFALNCMMFNKAKIFWHQSAILHRSDDGVWLFLLAKRARWLQEASLSDEGQDVQAFLAREAFEIVLVDVIWPLLPTPVAAWIRHCKSEESARQ